MLFFYDDTPALPADASMARAARGARFPMHFLLTADLQAHAKIGTRNGPDRPNCVTKTTTTASTAMLLMTTTTKKTTLFQDFYEEDMFCMAIFPPASMGAVSFCLLGAGCCRVPRSQRSSVPRRRHGTIPCVSDMPTRIIKQLLLFR